MGFYKILFYGGIICAIIFLILTIVLFFVLKIPAVFGNLSGSTQRKRIEEIRKSGYESVSKKKAIHDSTSKITVREAEMKSADSGKLEEQKKEEKKETKSKYTPRPDVGFGNISDDTSTEVLGYGKNGEAAAKSKSAYDDVDDESTEILRENSIDGEEVDEEATALLRGNTGDLRSDDPRINEEETAILGSEGEALDLYDDDLDEDVTDVLSGKGIEVDDISHKVTGNFGEDITSVLTSNDRTDIVNDMGTGIGSTDEMTTEDEDDDTDYMEQINIIYSATVVNTSESLDD
jgi:hypothetical protein